MNPQRRAYAAELYQSYRRDDAAQADRLNRWRSIEPESAELLAILILAKQAKRILEIGTSGGYSALWLADAAEQTGGHLTSLEIEEARRQTALGHLEANGLTGRATLLCTDAADFLQKHAEPYDFILLDAERPAYPAYWPHLTQCLSEKGALLVVDNVVSHGGQVQEFIALVQADERFESTTLPTGAGLLLVTRK
ncbi:O-methyltransferase [Neisseria sp.]|uniref:O-methyltransferase n=1 Tax=Neisseria sp. TaxID=192066 RepID=UPI0035A013C3